MQRKFTLDYWKDGKWYVGRLRDVPDVFSQAKSLTELLENITEAYRLMLEEGRIRIPVRRLRSKEVELEIAI